MPNRKAYVLILVETGKAETVVEALRSKPGITEADMVVGPHDVVAILNGPDAEAIARIVVNDIQSTRGVQRTLTYMVIGQ
ncbi:MAG: Lrp/AsnC ligand binding domain-containing protein [Dehalococcoidia bacterium]|nr:Lrp/AsnC ligand binding domain-containing protein [Dehalococcoidia bacterium]